MGGLLPIELAYNRNSGAGCFRTRQRSSISKVIPLCVASLMSLGKPIHSAVKRRSLGEALTRFDRPMTDTHNVIMDNRYSAQLTREIAEVLVERTVQPHGPGCSNNTLRGCAAWVPMKAPAFGMRSEHVMIEIIVQNDDGDGRAERAWIEETARRLDALSQAGEYPNLLASEDPRADASCGPNPARLAAAKRRYDPSERRRHATDLPG